MRSINKKSTTIIPVPTMNSFVTLGIATKNDSSCGTYGRAKEAMLTNKNIKSPQNTSSCFLLFYVSYCTMLFMTNVVTSKAKESGEILVRLFTNC